MVLNLNHKKIVVINGWAAMMAGSVEVSISVILIFQAFNKYFGKGLSEGSVKG